ncbi:putative nucleic acid-binding Zn-ribbon protein [Luteibacter sp. 1214]|uniref:hypothetical protein n=1 Tax=Luteibacter sp. 1214 TaxID=2817735 RepID=UPI00285D5263|nr:hypothetical protein [Luteibacter sp. 1214]MDR6642778.1 putative nucleic acid-binding Zn-ribbon protein [Luteibacter sp. 1214]
MDLSLKVLLSMVEKVTAPLRSISGESGKTAKALKETRDRLRELEKTQGTVNAFKNLKRGTAELQRELKTARDNLKAVTAAHNAAVNPTKKQTAALVQAKAAVQGAERAYSAHAVKLREVHTQMASAGINTKKLASFEKQLRADIEGTNAALTTQKTKLGAISEQQRRMGAARSQMQQGQATGAHLAVGGAAALATGQGVIAAVRPTIDEAKAFQVQVSQLRAQGIGDAAVADAVKFARGMDVIGSSATDNLKLVKEANSVLRDMHEAEQVSPYLARMKFGIEAVMAQGGHGEGHGQNAETMFMDLLKVAELRGAAKNPESLKRVLDFATQAYVGSGGLVKPEDLLNMIKTGGVAAKQLDDTSFFFGLLHTMQEMGGHRAGTGLATGYQNWAAGRSTQQSAEELYKLGLLKKDSVLYGTTGHVKKVLPDALKEGELYRSNPFEYLMTRVIPKINPHGALSDQQVVSKINALFSGRKGGDLFASLYLERANIAKHLAAVPKAYGVNALYDEARGTAGGMEIDLEAKKRDLYRELGTQVLPMYVAGLSKLVAIVRGLNRFAEAHPRIAKAFTVTAGGFGVLMTAAGGLMIALGGLLSQLAMLRFAFKAAGIRLALSRILGGAAAATESGAAAASTATGGAAQAGLLSRVGVAARGVLMGIAGASMTTVATVGGLIVVVAAVALAIRKYWGPITAWFEGVGQGIAQGVSPALASVKVALAPLADAFGVLAGWLQSAWQWFTQLIQPVQATTQQLDAARANGAGFGQVIGAVMGGVIQAITFGVRLFVLLGQAIGTAAGFVVTSWGPVRDFFAGLWSSVRDAAAAALGWIESKIQAVRGVIERLYAMWQKINGGSTTSPEPLQWIMPGDSDRARQITDAIARNPVGSAGAVGGNIVKPQAIPTRGNGGDTYQVHVDARGLSREETTRAMNDAFANERRKRAAESRSSYHDKD